MTALGLVACQPGGASQQTVDPQERAARVDSVEQHVAERLRVRVEAERRGLDALDPSSSSETIHLSSSVIRWYEHRAFAPAWVDGAGPLPVVDSLIDALAMAPREGLPEVYHREEIETLVRSIRSRSGDDPDVSALVDLEFLCTDATLLYGTHLLTGRVNPEEITPSWNIPRRTSDLISRMEAAISSGEIASMFEKMRPQGPDYRSLVQALDRYRAIEASGGWPSLPEGSTLGAGAVDARVPLLRKRLAVTRDLPVPPDSLETDAVQVDTAQVDSARFRFDTDLEAALIRFQERHGLDPDGRMGKATQAALNRTAAQRVDQIVANLERWRWMPDSLGSRYLLVNISGFTLRVVEEGRDVLTMRVVTGKPFRQTPVFSGNISYLVLNPYWHVPHSLAVEDKLPKIKRNPAYLAQQGLEVFRGWDAGAAPVDPSTIDWSSLSESRFPYRLRQKPGPLNALGQVKFMFPNAHSVYLHDTPTRGLFAEAERSFSSGCIRVEKPMELAAYLLAGSKGWTREKIDKVVAEAAGERAITLPEKVPVHLQYWTAWADGETVSFRNDIYNRDQPLLEALGMTRADMRLADDPSKL